MTAFSFRPMALATDPCPDPMISGYTPFKDFGSLNSAMGISHALYELVSRAPIHSAWPLIKSES